MRLRIALAALIVLLMLAAVPGPPPVGGAGPTPPALLDRFVYLPLVAVPVPTPTATPTPPATPTPTVTPTPSGVCQGDEEMSFAPNPGATGASQEVAVTSSRASVNVAMQVARGGAGVALAGPSVSTGGKGYIWAWTFTPYQPGLYDARFYVNLSDLCASGSVQVNGSVLPTPTPMRTATPGAPTATPTPAPTAPPGGVEWDWRLTFLRVGISGASVPPGQQYWKVTKGIFQNSEEGGGNHAIFVDVLGADGQRPWLSEGSIVGTVAWPSGSTPLTWGAKPPNEYPVNFAMGSDDGLGSDSIWLTLDGLPSERVYGMGLVAADGISAPLLAEPGKIHVNYLITFRRTTRTSLEMETTPRLPDCYSGRRWLPSPPIEGAAPKAPGPVTSPLWLPRHLITPGPACQGPGQ